MLDPAPDSLNQDLQHCLSRCTWQGPIQYSRMQAIHCLFANMFHKCIYLNEVKSNFNWNEDMRYCSWTPQ
jgi:hypothetical protein